MIELTPYPAYKDANLLWLDSIPEHWELKPNRALLRERRDRVGDKAKDHVLLSLTLSGVIPRDMENPKGKFPAEFNTYKIVRSGDMIFCLFDVDETPRTVGHSNFDGMITGAYSIYSPTDLIDASYLYQYYLTVDNGKLLKPIYSGLRKTIPRNIFACTKSPCPPPDEQATIVRFLGHANQKIDSFIRAKRRLIGLLNEQKQTIIHKVVIRGLDANAKLKPSGIEWVGDIPEHWETPLNQRIFRENIRPHEDRPEVQLSLSQRDGLIPTDSMKERSLQTSSYDNWKVVFPGDLVLNRFKAHLGVFFAATLRGIVSFHYGVFEPQRLLNTKYFELLCHTAPYKTIYAGRSNGMTVGLQNLSNQNFYGVRSIVPPVEEQNAIVEFAEAETADIDAAIARVEREIKLVQEFRARLMSDIVTGKLDVRTAAAQLPDLPVTEASPAGADGLVDELDDELDMEEVDE